MYELAWMAGGGPLENIFVERLSRSVKYESIYLIEYRTVKELESGLGNRSEFYNSERLHQSLDYCTLAGVHFGT